MLFSDENVAVQKKSCFDDTVCSLIHSVYFILREIIYAGIELCHDEVVYLLAALVEIRICTWRNL